MQLTWRHQINQKINNKLEGNRSCNGPIVTEQDKPQGQEQTTGKRRVDCLLHG